MKNLKTAIKHFINGPFNDKWQDKEREGEIEKDKKSTPIFYGEFKKIRVEKRFLNLERE